ncbi:hypothetical protein WJX81_005040 [Elliptochloris bilobata]|uniref:Protein kinase domain-containing protein n=1 Tax=Elliptochloris bilobata TaxID=381761 RepID=A0AAW1SD25_9CHLO
MPLPEGAPRGFERRTDPGQRSGCEMRRDLEREQIRIRDRKPGDRDERTRHDRGPRIGDKRDAGRLRRSASPSREASQGNSRPALANADFLGDLRRLAQERQAAAARRGASVGGASSPDERTPSAREGEREDGEAEPGELQPHERKRRRRSREPIIWAAPARAPSGNASDPGGGRTRDGDDDTPDGRVPGSGLELGGSPEEGGATAPHVRTAAERAAAELEGFLGQGGATLDLDPDAPPAMKASPSVSPGDAGDSGAGVPEGVGAMDVGGAGEDDGAVATGPARPAATSRWLATEDEEEEELGDQGRGATAGKGDAATADAGATGPFPSPGPEIATDPALPDADGAADGDSAEAEAPRANMLRECRSVEEFERLNRISEGTYGVVYRARDKATGRIVALKKVKMDKEKDGFPLTSIREINILLSFRHDNIVNVTEVVVGRQLDSIFMVMEYMEHDLKGLSESMRQPFTTAEVKCLMQQLLAGVVYLHENWVLHRDLKTSNILYNNRGELKICDMGLARQYGSPLQPYTHNVVTLWYRAPELLLGVKKYSTPIDVWSVGCIMAELLTKETLFPGKAEFDQILRIFKLLGAPTLENWPGASALPHMQKFNFPPTKNSLRDKFPPPARLDVGRPGLSDAGFDLLSRLLALDPARRIKAEDALAHAWFREHPLPKERALMPTFPTGGEGARHHKRPHHHPSPDPRLADPAQLLRARAAEVASVFSRK